jgi:hypothetical protein
MSISGISAASSAAYIQQSQKIGEATGTPQPTAATTAAQATPTALTGPAAQPASTQQPGAVHHHHRHGGGNAAAQSTDLTQSGTASAGGSNTLNTVV